MLVYSNKEDLFKEQALELFKQEGLCLLKCSGGKLLALGRQSVTDTCKHNLKTQTGLQLKVLQHTTTPNQQTQTLLENNDAEELGDEHIQTLTHYSMPLNSARGRSKTIIPWSSEAF